MEKIATEWKLFLQDYTAQLLNPELCAGGIFLTDTSFKTIEKFGLEHALHELVIQTGNAIGFHVGLPDMPHDFGHIPYSLTIYRNRILVTFPHNGHKIRKLARKTGVLDRLVKSGEILSGFDLPIEWRFGNESILPKG